MWVSIFDLDEDELLLDEPQATSAIDSTVITNGKASGRHRLVR
jgi:hypothetical protein